VRLSRAHFAGRAARRSTESVLRRLGGGKLTALREQGDYSWTAPCAGWVRF
jgi:hypothetical protein